MSQISNKRIPHARWQRLRGALCALGLAVLTILVSLGVNARPALASNPTVMFTKPMCKFMSEGTISPGDTVAFNISLRLDDLEYGGLNAITKLKIYSPVPKTISNVKGTLFLNDTEQHNDWGTLDEPPAEPDPTGSTPNTITFTFNSAGISALKAKGSNAKTLNLHVTGTLSSKLEKGANLRVSGFVSMNEITQDSYPLETTIAGYPEYTLSKNADKTQAKKGETVSYTLNVANTGEGDGKDVVIEDTPGVGLSLVASSITVNGLDEGSTSTTDSSASSSGKVKVTVPVLKQSDDFTITYNATVTSESPEGTALQNSATLTDSNHRQKTAEKSVTLVAPGLSLQKTTTQKTVGENEKVDYTLTLKNTSTVLPATTVVVNDAPPAGLTIDTGSVQVQGADGSPQTSATENSLQVSLASLAASKTVTITYQATATPSAVREQALSSTATAKADGISQVSSAADVTVLTNPHFEFTMTGHAPESNSASVGSTVSFDVSITNDTPHAIKQVTFQNEIPQGLVITQIPEITNETLSRAAAGSQVQFDNGTLKATVPELESSGTLHMSYTAIVAEDAAESVTNTASVSAQGADTQNQSFTFNVTHTSTPLPQTGLPSAIGLLLGGGGLSTTALGVASVARTMRREDREPRDGRDE